MIPAWQVVTWSPVVATLSTLSRTVAEMRHLGTSVHIDSDEETMRYGQVLWGGVVDGEKVGIAWDWAEARRDIVALADPMTIMSNVILVDEDGTPLGEQRRNLYLNTAIHELEWQEQIPATSTAWDGRVAA